MKIQFDSSLDYQKDAIKSITDIFQGQEIFEANFTVYSPQFLAKQQNIAFNEIVIKNVIKTLCTALRNIRNVLSKVENDIVFPYFIGV